MKLRGVLSWAALAVATSVPLVATALSPLLEWRDPVYILAGFAGVVALALLLVQPLLVAGALSGVAAQRAHIWTGTVLVVAVVTHVAGLWITSPPDVVDVLLFRSPTPFAIWGVLAMWAVFAAALLAAIRHKIGPRAWRLGHSALVLMVIIGSVLHAWLIEGTMEVFSKAALGLLVLGATGWALRRRRVWRLLQASPEKPGSSTI